MTTYQVTYTVIEIRTVDVEADNRYAAQERFHDGHHIEGTDTHHADENPAIFSIVRKDTLP
jgi:hypothetical protein